MRRFSTLLLAVVFAFLCSAVLSSRATAQSAPSVVTATSSSSTSVAVAWSQVSGASGYTVSYGTASAATGATKSVSGGSTLSTTISGLTSGTTYYFIVAATPGGTYSSPSVSAVPGSSPLAAPNPLACDPSSGQVAVSWGAVSGATGYAIYRGLSSSTTSLFASVSSATQSYTDTSVSNNTTYYYRVAAFNSSGCSTQSRAVSATPPGTGVVGPPQDLLYQNGSGDVDVYWEAVSGASSYNIYRSTASSADCASTTIPYASATSQQFVDTTVTSGSTYWYCVTAVNAAGEGPKSTVIEVVAGSARGQAPSSLVARAGTSIIYLTWSAPTGGTSPDGYAIYKSQDNSTYSLYAQTSGAAATSYNDSSVTNGTPEYYRVAAVYSGVASSYVSASATPVASPTLSGTVSNTPAVSLSWTQAAGATGYSIYKSSSTPVSTTGTPYATTGSATSVTYTDTGVSNGQTDYYCVVATNSSGASTPSNTVTEQLPSSAPTNLVATPGDAQVVLTWTAPAGGQGVTGYNVYRGNASGGESATSINGGSPVTATTYTDTGLTDGTTYYYEVTALSPGGESARSNEASATPAHAPPTVATAASASPNPVMGTTTALSVLGADNAGESTLTYTWSASGPAGVTYSGTTNGTNAAKNITATFTVAGTYTFTVLITDTYGGTVSSSVSVVVNQTLTTISVSPGSATVTAAGTQQFTASATDQFGTALTTQPTFTWAAGRGTITSAGNYTASSSTGSDTVTATSGSVHGSAAVTVSAPVGPSGVAITINTATPITGTAASLTGTATGTGTLTYTWSASPSTVTFSPNGTSAAANTTATFTAAGTYTITLIVTDSYGQTASATATVAVNQTASTISVSPATAYVATYATQQFSASEKDQFGAALNTQPAFTWSAGSGSVTSAGNYTASSSTGSDTVTAKDGSLQGQATITVTVGNAPTITLTAQVQASNGNNIQLNWQPVANAYHYNLYRSTTPGGKARLLTYPMWGGYPTGATNYLDQSLPSNTRYYYIIAPVSSSGVQGVLSNEASAKTNVAQLAVPVFTHVVAGNAQVTLSWTSISGATAYILTRTYGAYPPISVWMSVSSSGYTDTGLTNGTTYTYTVTAINADGLGASSSSVTAEPGSTAPAAPAGLTAQESGATSINLSWPQVSGASSYNIYRSTVTGEEGTTPYKTNVTTYAPSYAPVTYPDSGLTSGTTYYYRVSAVSSVSAESALSNEASATPNVTPLPAPTLQATSGNLSVTLTWTTVSGATSYNLTRYTTNQYGPPTSTIITTGISGTSYTDATIQYGVSYSYSVAAVNVNGVSNQSNSVAVSLSGFGLLMTPLTVTVPRGELGTITIMTPAATNFTGLVNLSVSGAPTNVSAWCLPNTVTVLANPASTPLIGNYSPGTTLYINVPSGATTGTYSLTITGQASSGASYAFTQTQAVTLIVQ